jgi:hypothetical protein
MPSTLATKKHTARIREAYTRQPGPLNVDRDAGIIYGAKILGWESDNNRRYVPEAVARAVKKGLYTDRKVFCDHPGKPGEQRPVRDLFAKITNPKLHEDGLYGDLHCLTTHPIWESVAEDCEKGLGLFGLSHNAEAATWEIHEGVQVITDLLDVESVDLVSHPATCSNLWESHRKQSPMKKKTFKQLVRECKWVKPALRKAILEASCDYGMDTMEMYPERHTDASTTVGDGADIDAGDMSGPAAGEPSKKSTVMEEDVDPRELLAQAVAGLCRSSDPKHHELGMKLMKLMKPEGDVEEEEGHPPEEDEEQETTKDIGKDGSAGESRRGRKLGLTEAVAREYCEMAGIECDDETLELLEGLDESKARKLVKSLKGRRLQESRQVMPRTGGSIPLTESRNGNGTGSKMEFKASENRLAFLRGAGAPN